MFVTAAAVTDSALGLVGRTSPGFLVYPNARVSPFTLPGGGGPSRGVAYLDRVTAVEGLPVSSGEEVWKSLEAHAPGDGISYRIERRGVERTVEIPAGIFGPREFLALWVLLLAAGLAFAGSGGAVLWYKPDEASSGVFFWFCLTSALYAVLALDYTTRGVYPRFFLLMPALLPPACLALGLAVPEPHPWLARKPLRLVWVYGSSIPLMALYQAWIHEPRLFPLLDRATVAYSLVSAIAMPSLLLRTALRGSTGSIRRRARDILLGVTVPSLFVVFIIADTFLWKREGGGAQAWPLVALLMPIAIAWAILRRDFLGLTEGRWVEDLTFLFTDLKSSTTLYEEAGDIEAFGLVQEHFERLRKVIRRFGGTVVKTIGDSIMAAFPEPERAVQAALATHEEIGKLNEEHRSGKLILKVGLHRGPSVAVALNNRPDYFGQAVNVAARFQELAGPGEICLSEEVRADPAVEALLDGRDRKGEEVRLRGLDRALVVYRLRPVAPGTPLPSDRER